MRRFRAVVITAAVAAAASFGLGSSPAHASNVDVKFGISAGLYAPTGAACTVSVPAGADGVAVLDAAVARGCITSYETATYGSYGAYLTCVNGICQQGDGLVSYWALFDSSPFPAAYGLSGFEADQGDELIVSYTNFLLLTPFYL